MMHGHEKSDSVIVAVKPANKAVHPAAEQSAAEPAAAESVERRAETKGNADQQSTCRTQSRISVSQALERMRQAIAVWTRGRSRMRESRTYGLRGGRSAMSVPPRPGRLCPVLALCHEYRRSTRQYATVREIRRALRGRKGVHLKPPQAAVVKSDGGERCGKVGTRFRQAALREASASEPLMTWRKRIRRCQNRGLHSSGISLPTWSYREEPYGSAEGGSLRAMARAG